MERRNTKTAALQNSQEESILSTIVDAMLDVETDLKDAATCEDWHDILVDSCRRQKRLRTKRQAYLVAAC